MKKIFYPFVIIVFSLLLCTGNKSFAQANCGWQFRDAFTQNQGTWGASFSKIISSRLYPNGVTEIGIPGSSGYSIVFLWDYVDAYLPQTGPPSALTQDVNYQQGPAPGGAFGGEILALKLNVDASDSNFIPGTSVKHFGDILLCNFSDYTALNGLMVRQFLTVVNNMLGGAAGPYSITDMYSVLNQLNASFFMGNPSAFAQAHLSCNGGWASGELFTYNQYQWGYGSLWGTTDYVYGRTFGIMTIGNSGVGHTVSFTSGSAASGFLPQAGAPDILNANLTDPTTTSAGGFAGEVLALMLNVDYSDSNQLIGNAAIHFGDLVLDGLTDLTALNGQTVRDVLQMAHTALSGGSTPYTPLELVMLLNQLNATFDAGFPTQFAQDHLLNPKCSPDNDHDGYTIAQGDCDDSNPSVHPGATEICNGIDDDCDGLIDEGVKTTFYRDADGDGYGNPSLTTEACTAPTGYVSNNTDCDDSKANVHPGAIEICNGIDDNCNGLIDEGVKTTFYRDADGDGYGNPSITIQACTKPVGYVSNNTDCDDSKVSVHPGAVEICNGIDDDCDGEIDESCPKINIINTLALEGDNGTNNALFILILSKPSSVPVTVQYQTMNNTAIAGQDYVQKNGTVTFPANSLLRLQAVIVQVKGDVLDEPDETFKVQLSNATNAVINTGIATCIILDDDPEPCLRINDVSATENSQQAVLQVNLSSTSGKTVKVRYDTKDGTAKSPGDYTSINNGTINFQPGETVKNITVVIKKDALNEPTEKFKVKLSDPENANISTNSYCIARKDATVSVLNSPTQQNNRALTKAQLTDAEETPNISVPGILSRHSQLLIHGIKNMNNGLMILDSKGAVIASLSHYTNTWIPGNIATGIYFYQLQIRTEEGYKVYRGKIFITE